MTTRFDISTIAEALTARAAEVAIALLGEPNSRLSNNQELRFGRKGSLAVVITGARAGSWFDHENGVGGDLFNLIRRINSSSFVNAVASAERIIGTPQTQSTVQTPPDGGKSTVEDASWDQSRAGELWQQAVPIAETIAAHYLATRRLLIAPDIDGTVLRFHPSCPFGGTRHPCLLVLMRGVLTNEPRAIQRTALTQNGQKIDRMTLGPKTGAAIKLSTDECVTTGLAVGEGLETVLSAMQLGFRPAWALGDANNVRAFPVLSGIECLTIAVDNDESGTGQRAALECSSRWTGAGREVFRIIPDRTGDDLNDVVQRTGC
jgi:Toprim domain-containing protein